MDRVSCRNCGLLFERKDARWIGDKPYCKECHVYILWLKQDEKWMQVVIDPALEGGDLPAPHDLRDV